MTEDLRDQLENAPVVPPLDADQAPPEEDTPPPPRRSDGRPYGEIWDGCPVTPLGVYGDVSYYLDVLGQLRAVKRHDNQMILHVFGHRNGLLSGHFPQFDKNGNPRPAPVFDGTRASAIMMQACAERGVWSPTSRMRGAGCWLDDDARMIVHAGDAVLVKGEWKKPGVYGGKVYAAADPVPRPVDTITRPHAAEDLLGDLETWNWRRPEVDPQLVLGSACAQIVGGALDWRPVFWISGDASTGKSTLQALLLALHGGSDGLLQAADATEAGIRSVLGYSALPVAIDELEPDKDNPRKVKAVVELARRAASGAQIFRGSADHKGHQSTAYSCFLFSSILVPPMPAQDRSRLVLLDLNPIPPGAPKMNLDRRRLRGIGAHLRRALLDGWPTWEERLALWRSALAEEGQTGRGADNYATVMALADMALDPHQLPTSDTLQGWAKKLGHAVTEDAVEVGSNAEDMLVKLLSQPIDIWRRGRKHTVAEWLQFIARVPGAPDQLSEVSDVGAANKMLSPFGLRVKGRQDRAELFIANKPIEGLCELFRDTMWADGGWAQAARRLPGAKQANLTLVGVASRGYYVPFRSIPGLLAFPTDKEQEPQGYQGHKGQDIDGEWV